VIIASSVEYPEVLKCPSAVAVAVEVAVAVAVALVSTKTPLMSFIE